MITHFVTEKEQIDESGEVRTMEDHYREAADYVDDTTMLMLIIKQQNSRVAGIGSLYRNCQQIQLELLGVYESDDDRVLGLNIQQSTETQLDFLQESLADELQLLATHEKVLFNLILRRTSFKDQMEVVQATSERTETGDNRATPDLPEFDPVAKGC